MFGLILPYSHDDAIAGIVQIRGNLAHAFSIKYHT